jgi:glycosyltransferase involved in cell wall biosynthesis
MTLFVDATTGFHARGIATVIEGVVSALRDRDADAAVAGRRADRGVRFVERRVRLARTIPGRLAYQRVLLPLDIERLRRRGAQIDRALLLDSYVPLIPGRGVRYGVLVHDLLPLTRPQYWNGAQLVVKRAAFASIRRHAPVVFTSSSYNADEVGRLLDLEARVVRFGCGQVSDSEADDALHRDLPARERSVVAVGAIEPRKNLPALLKSFEALKATDPSTSLVLVGTGSEVFEQQLRGAVAASAARDAVEIVRDADRPTTLELIARAGVLALPSSAEGFGLPALEALALGTPVVASELDAIRSWAGDAIAYAEPGDHGAFAQALGRQLDAPDASRRDGQSFAQRFRWRECATALADW